VIGVFDVHEPAWLAFLASLLSMYSHEMALEFPVEKQFASVSSKRLSPRPRGPYFFPIFCLSLRSDRVFSGRPSAVTEGSRPGLAPPTNSIPFMLCRTRPARATDLVLCCEKRPRSPAPEIALSFFLIGERLMGCLFPLFENYFSKTRVSPPSAENARGCYSVWCHSRRSPWRFFEEAAPCLLQ